MCTSRLLILGFISIVEIGSAQALIKRETYFRSPMLQYQRIPIFLPSKNLRYPSLYNLPTTTSQKVNPIPPNYLTKKINLWMDPMRYKKTKVLKRLKQQRRPNKPHQLQNWNYENSNTNNLPYSKVPSVYLEPPREMKINYQSYTNIMKNVTNDENLKNKPFVDPWKNRTLDVKNEKLNEDNDRSNYVRDHAPEQEKVDTNDDGEPRDGSKKMSQETSSESPKLPKDRVEFHLQGHDGPETYVFGFDTGEGNNRQFRLEERHEDGTVTGQYGYIDARGKLRKVRYKSSPTDGYKIKHQEATADQEV